MARINIEDDLDSKIEFKKLLKYHDYDYPRSYGDVVIFLRTAQYFFIKNLPMTTQELEDRGLSHFIHLGWLTEKDDGSWSYKYENEFEWLVICLKQGRKGGKNKEKLKIPELLDNAANTRQITQTLSTPLVPSLVPSPDHTLIKSSSSYSYKEISEEKGILASLPPLTGGREPEKWEKVLEIRNENGQTWIPSKPIRLANGKLRIRWTNQDTNEVHIKDIAYHEKYGI